MDVNEAEKEYRWLDAAKSFEEILTFKSDRHRFVAGSWEKIGFYYGLASNQAESVEEFKKLRQLAIEAYETAAKFFEENPNLDSQGKSAECLFNAEYVRSWLVSNSAYKEKVLDKCYILGNKALGLFEKIDDKLSYGRICNILSRCLFDRLYMTLDEDEKIKFAQEGIELSEEAASIFKKLDEKDDLLLALSLASLLSWYYANIGDESIRKNLSKKCLEYSETMKELLVKTKNLHYTAISLWAQVFTTMFFTEDIDLSLNYAKEMWQTASTLRDKYLKGIASYLLAFVTDWMVPGESNPDLKKQKYNEVIGYSEQAIKYLKVVNQDEAMAEVYLVYPQSYFSYAREFAITPTEKLALSKKSVRIGEKGLEYALRSGSPDAIGSNLHALSKAYQYYSTLEPRAYEKPSLLKTALGYRKEFIKIVQKAFTSNQWILGVGLVYAAQIEADLAKFENEEAKKKNILSDALSDIEKGVSLCEAWVACLGWRNAPSLVATVAEFEDTFGAILKENYFLTRDNNNLIKATKIYTQAAENFKKVDLPSRVAESYWKMASNLDVITEYSEASENFEKAFAGFKVAAKKIKNFGDFYLDYSNYMKAWSEIENAKFAHNNDDYNIATEHYQNASNLLKKSKLWNYLSLNFYAWSLLEQAEDFSRKENPSESIEFFKSAIKFLQESKINLEIKLQDIDKNDEKSMVKRLVVASAAREKYCSGRIAIEEARLLDKQGNHASSSQKYGAAAIVFQKINSEYSEQIGTEVKPLVFLCQAWQKMTMGEARNSPIMFEEASELFKKANEFARNESESLLALAHSSFCKALEAGTEFEITRNMDMYTETKKHMDAASNYYLRAGFETFSEYAKGTQRLFDAYVFINNAKKETDPRKEAKFFMMAEKVLKISAESFAKAKHQEKKDMVQRLLQKIMEEKELAVSLGEVFHAPTVTSSAGSFTTLSPNYEMAVGLERFEHADIQAKIIRQRSDFSVGEDASLKIQIVNVGKEPVLLARIENVLPVGFQLIDKPDSFSFKNNQLITMGKRLDPLKSEEIAITLKPFKSGVYEAQPRIICIGDSGEQMMFLPDPLTYEVSDAALPGRIPTGYKDLDNLLLGGLPEEYSVVLVSPSNDERGLLIRRFLETGVKKGEITFFITVEVSGAKDLAEEFPTSFYLFVCNPRAEVMIKSLPNVYKIKGVESLTDIDISLVKAIRSIGSTEAGPKRVCIEILSDVLLQHHAVVTRKWLSGLLADLRSKGFTTLAIINPQMHPAEEVHAILGLFDGEIRIFERETEEGLQKVLRIRKLYNQKYIENELIVTRQRLES